MPRARRSFLMRWFVDAIIGCRRMRERFAMDRISLVNAIRRAAVINERVEAAKSESFARQARFSMRGVE